MTRAAAPRHRQRGMIDTLPSGGLRIRVYAGVDPLSKCRHDLTEVIPAGPNAAREAERAGTRLLNQVDERRNPRTRATVNQLLDRWLDVLDVEPSTRRGYVLKMDTWSTLSTNAAILIYRQTEQAEDVAELAGTERVTEGGADCNTDNTRRLSSASGVVGARRSTRACRRCSRCIGVPG